MEGKVKNLSYTQHTPVQKITQAVSEKQLRDTTSEADAQAIDMPHSTTVYQGLVSEHRF